MDKTDALRQMLLSEIEKLKTVDCHSHTYLRRTYYEVGRFDLFSLTNYFERDISSTVGAPIYENTKTDEERWFQLKAVLQKSRNVSYWRFHLIVYQKLFGLKDEELNDENWRIINDAICQKSRDPSWYEYVTKNLCKLETQVRNIPWFEDWEPEYFTPILRMENALTLHEIKIMEQLENYLNVSISSLKEAKRALQTLMQRYLEKGAVGIKLGHAYNRTLHSVCVDENKASQIFDRAIGSNNISTNEIKELQDHIIFYLAELCQEMKLVFQIHTGVQTNWGNIPDSDPLLLIPLLKAFPEVRFDLFHAGYPYSREIGMLGKHFPNVWLNMAWMYLVSISASRQILSEWIDLVPGYRILGFGSDVHFPEMIYGHLEMARSCVADVLADKIKYDFLTEKEAVSLIHKLFRENGMELYNLHRPERINKYGSMEEGQSLPKAIGASVSQRLKDVVASVSQRRSLGMTFDK